MIEENTLSFSLGKQKLGLTVGLSCLLLVLYIAMAAIVYRPRRIATDANKFQLPTQRLSKMTYSSKTAKTILDTILSIQPKDSSEGGGETSEAFVKRICDDMLEKLPNDYIAYEISWDSSTLGFWFSEPIDRNTQFHSWCFDGRPDTFWMTGFFNAQGFLTAIRQELTRAHKGWALETVIIHNEVMRSIKDDITSPAGEGVFVYGLYLEGVGWDKRGSKLVESKPKVLFELMPV